MSAAARQDLSRWGLMHGESMKSLLKFVKFLLLAGFVLGGFVFAYRNSVAVGLWLFADFSPRPLAVWLLLAFTGGSVLGLLLGLGVVRKMRLAWQLRQLQAQLKACRQELQVLQGKPGAVQEEPSGG